MSNDMYFIQQQTELYESNILLWAKARRILQASDLRSQFLKSIEEFSEVGLGILEDNLEEIIDGIGDTFVTIVMCNHFLNGADYLDQDYSVFECFQLTIGADVSSPLQDHRVNQIPMKDVRDAYLELAVSMGKLAMVIMKDKTDESRYTVIGGAYKSLICLANSVPTTLGIVECMDKAYNEIKDRKGTMAGGVFVKES